MKQTRRVRLFIAGDESLVDVVDTHSMFEFAHNVAETRYQSYSDPTAAQYGREQGLRPAAEYPVDSNHSKARAFDSAHHTYLQELHGKKKSIRTKLSLLKEEAFNRAMNTIVCHTVILAGGQQCFWNM
jgi:hypothetical protein